MPSASFLTLGIDPGSTHTGYAVIEALPDGEHLLTSGTWTRSPRVRPPARHVANCQGIAALVLAYAPGLIAYEEFVYRGRDNRIDPNTAKWVDRIIGYLLSLADDPTHVVVERSERLTVCRLAGLTGHATPIIVGLDAADWGQALVGQARHDKPMIAWTVNLRLGTTFAGDHRDNHQADACGIGLAALDRYRMARRCRTVETP